MLISIQGLHIRDIGKRCDTDASKIGRFDVKSIMFIPLTVAQDESFDSSPQFTSSEKFLPTYSQIIEFLLSWTPERLSKTFRLGRICHNLIAVNCLLISSLVGFFSPLEKYDDTTGISALIGHWYLFRISDKLAI
jgi:hypothetical protein